MSTAEENQVSYRLKQCMSADRFSMMIHTVKPILKLVKKYIESEYFV